MSRGKARIPDEDCTPLQWGRREYRRRNLEAGLCGDCPNPRSPLSNRFCEPCRLRQVARALNYYRRKHGTDNTRRTPRE
jgi:hypothetical protein